MKFATVATVLSAISLFPLAAWSGGGECTAKQLKQAANADFVFADWKELFASQVLFKRCDQGGDASEGYSEAVVRLLSDHWDKLPELADLSRRHRNFRTFVLRHIDATTNDDDLKKILLLSEKQCPAHAMSLCSAIGAQARMAIEESKS